MKLDALISNNIYDIVKELNSLNVKREDIVTIFQDSKGRYIVFFYK